MSEHDELQRDHRSRWWAVAVGVLFSFGLAAFFSIKEGFFDPWFFLMVVGPAVGIGLVVGLRHLLENWWFHRRVK